MLALLFCRTYFHIMWKYLEQRSFPLTESQYMEQLNAVAECLTEWGAASAVRSGIDRAHSKGPGYTGGGGARAVSAAILLDPHAALRHCLIAQMSVMSQRLAHVFACDRVYSSAHALSRCACELLLVGLLS